MKTNAPHFRQKQFASPWLCEQPDALHESRHGGITTSAPRPHDRGSVAQRRIRF
jgi:hypothetical protein